MSEVHVYNPYHPRWLRQPLGTYWWLRKWSYFAFILREASCLFVAWFVVYLLLLVNAVRQGAASYAAFIAWSATPWLLLLNIVTLVFLVYHAVTFFEAAPQAVVVHVRRRRVPGQLVLMGHFVGWAIVSVFVSWLLVGA